MAIAGAMVRAMPGGAFQSQRLTFDVRLVFAANTNGEDIASLEQAEEIGQRVANDVHDALKAKFMERDAYIEPPRARFRNEPLGGVIDLSVTAGVGTAPHVLSTLQAQSTVRTVIRNSLKRKLRRPVELTRLSQRVRTREFLPAQEAAPAPRRRNVLGGRIMTIAAVTALVAIIAIGAVRFSRTPAADAHDIQPAITQISAPATAAPNQPELAEFLLPPMTDTAPEPTPVAAESEPAPVATPTPRVRRAARREHTCRRYTSERSGYAIIRCT